MTVTGRFILFLVFLSVPLNVVSEELSINLVKIAGSADQAVGEKLIMEVYKRAGINVTITAMPSKRALFESSEGLKDGETMRIWSVGERFPSLVRVPTPLSSIRTQAFAKKESKVSINEKADLAKYNLVITRGGQHTRDITRGLNNVQEISKMSLMMKFVREGRTEVALTGRLNGLSLLKRDGITDVVAVGEPLKELLLYHYLNKKNEHLVPQLDAVIRNMVDSGEMSRIRNEAESEYINNL